MSGDDDDDDDNNSDDNDDKVKNKMMQHFLPSKSQNHYRTFIRHYKITYKCISSQAGINWGYLF